MRRIVPFVTAFILAFASMGTVQLLSPAHADETPVDTDGDGVPDDLDNCVNVHSPDQSDSDVDVLASSRAAYAHRGSLASRRYPGSTTYTGVSASMRRSLIGDRSGPVRRQLETC